MKAYVSLPADATRDAKRLAPWLERALAHTLALPTKSAKGAQAAKTKTATATAKKATNESATARRRVR